MEEVYEWHPYKVFENPVVILLNQAVINSEFFVRLWSNAVFRVVVDGGGNQWGKLRAKFPELKCPNLVTGDFDSLQKELLDYFESNPDIQVFSTPNQDETDFTKCLRILDEKFLGKIPSLSSQDLQIVAFCENSGRLDQIMANIETLFWALRILPKSIEMYLQSSTSTSLLLREKSQNRIFISKSTMVSKEENKDIMFPQYCSLIPIGTPSIVSTKGLKWNLSNDTLAFGKLVSTSNEISMENENTNQAQDTVVEVKTSEPLLWTMEFELR